MTARFLNGFKITDIDQLILALIFRACLHGSGRPQVGEVTCGGVPQPYVNRPLDLGLFSSIIGRKV